MKEKPFQCRKSQNAQLFPSLILLFVRKLYVRPLFLKRPPIEHFSSTFQMLLRVFSIIFMSYPLFWLISSWIASEHLISLSNFASN